MAGRGTIVAVFAALVMLLAAGSGVQAQPPAPALPGTKEISITDPRGDVGWATPAGTQPPPVSSEHLDILRVWMNNESLDSLEVGLQLAELDPPSELSFLPALSREVNVVWTFGDVDFVVHFLNVVGPTTCASNAYLDRRIYFDETKTSWTGNSYCLETDVDGPSGTVVFTIPRTSLRNESETLFGPGHALTGFHASVYTYDPVQILVNALAPGNNVPTRFEDRAPDSGAGPDFRSTLGETFSSGHLSLFSLDPVRVSNGESTTFVYEVKLSNFATHAVSVGLESEHHQDGWTVRVPARLDVPAQTTIEFPVILSMGFSHGHSDIVYFQVRAQDLADASASSEINLGVFWTDIPQPAGHHDKLWLHSGPTRASYGIAIPFGPMVCETRSVWMNALEKDVDPLAEDAEVPGCAWDSIAVAFDTENFTRNQLLWSIPLRPGLLIGLDFDIVREGSFVTEMRSPFPVTGAVGASLVYHDPEANVPGCDTCRGRSIRIGEGESQPRSMGANAPALFEIPLTFSDEADLLPYKPSANIFLVVRFTSDRPNHTPNVATSGTSVTLLPKSSLLTLPLIEYHDPIDQSFQAVGSLRLEGNQRFEKPVNPGRAVLFSFTLTNTDKVERDVLLAVEGHNREWARFLEGDAIHLGPSEARNVTLVVEVPDVASEGERAELFAIAQAKDDPNVVALARLRATVVDPARHPVQDERPALANEASGIPSVGFGVGVAAIACLVWRRRR